MQTNIKVSGNIVKELSEKIPNNIIALNELIKNAYDAGAKEVFIKISSKEEKLIIKDDGIGMNLENIKNLFHISSSSKKYGKPLIFNDQTRFTQGSKGLGFLSVFKFGESVTWKTYQEKLLSFSVNYTDLIQMKDISNYEISVVESSNNHDKSGTEIEIKLTKYNLENILEYFSKSKNRKKLLNSFIHKPADCYEICHDENFIIKLEIDNEVFETDLNYKLENESKEQQLTRVKYDSKTGQLNYYSDLYGGILLYCENLEFDNEDFEVFVDLQTFVLKSHGKKKINDLFFHPANDELTPLVYVNNNLFNNYDLFNTNLMNHKKFGKILSQIIGYISIISDNKLIDFNSDRTKFVQNELTDKIINFLTNLNSQVQETGSIIKNELKETSNFLIQDSISEELLTDNFDLKSLINIDLKLKNIIKCERKDTYIEYDLLGSKRKVEIIKKEKPVKYVEEEYFLEKLPAFDETKKYNEILLNGKKVDSFNPNITGQWELIIENDREILKEKIKVLESRQPKITQKIKSVETHYEYGYDDLFIFENSFYEKDKGVIPTINTSDFSFILNDKRKGKLIFGKEGEFTFPVSIKDKQTKKEFEMDVTFIVISKDTEIKKIEDSVNFVKIPISKGKYLPREIIAYISELNKLEKMNEFSYTFVSSFRTLVELCVIDILKINNKVKHESLASNYQEVLSLYPDFLEKIDDKKDRQILSNLFKSVNSKGEQQAYLSFLNLCAHGSNTMISKEEVKSRTKELTLLLEFLNTLNKNIQV